MSLDHVTAEQIARD
jgi:hypothetical protein